MSGSLTSMAQSSCSPSPVLIPRPIGSLCPLSAPQAFCRPPSFLQQLSAVNVVVAAAALMKLLQPQPTSLHPPPPLWNVNCLSISLYNLFIASFIASSMTVIWFKAVLAPPHLLLFSSHAVYKSDKVKLTERYVVGSSSSSTGSCRGEGPGLRSAQQQQSLLQPTP